MSRSPRPGIRSLCALALLLALPFGLAACGSSDGGSGDSADTGVVRASAADFPSTKHRSLRLLTQGMQQSSVLAPSTAVLTTQGRQRFGFGLFDQGNKQISDLKVAVYYARGPDETAHGPYPASFRPIDVKNAFRSRTSSGDEDSSSGVYVAPISFRSPGSYLMLAISQLNGEWVASQPGQVKVTRTSPVPGAGDRAISVHTPTKEDVAGRLEKIDTRVPPDTMHDVDFADALAQHKPAVVLFATPALCQSRVCGPVTDVAEQVHHEYGDRVAFIHQEVYRDNDPNKGANPQLRAWHLDHEPFAFVVNGDGIVVSRLEGAFSTGELQTAVQKALG